MRASPHFDHIAVTVPDLDEQVDRLANDFGMEVRFRSEFFALVVDTATGFRFELSKSEDDQVHLRHFGFRADDVDATHAELAAAGMVPNQEPHRQDFAAMYTSFLAQPGGVEIQLVKYD